MKKDEPNEKSAGTKEQSQRVSNQETRTHCFFLITIPWNAHFQIARTSSAVALE